MHFHNKNDVITCIIHSFIFNFSQNIISQNRGNILTTFLKVLLQNSPKYLKTPSKIFTRNRFILNIWVQLPRHFLGNMFPLFQLPGEKCAEKKLKGGKRLKLYWKAPAWRVTSRSLKHWWLENWMGMWKSFEKCRWVHLLILKKWLLLFLPENKNGYFLTPKNGCSSCL